MPLAHISLLMSSGKLGGQSFSEELDRCEGGLSVQGRRLSVIPSDGGYGLRLETGNCVRT